MQNCISLFLLFFKFEIQIVSNREFSLYVTVSVSWIVPRDLGNQDSLSWMKIIVHVIEKNLYGEVLLTVINHNSPAVKFFA